eukprot:989192-Prymnesium_polylepis.1
MAKVGARQGNQARQGGTAREACSRRTRGECGRSARSTERQCTTTRNHAFALRLQSTPLMPRRKVCAMTMVARVRSAFGWW